MTVLRFGAMLHFGRLEIRYQGRCDDIAKRRYCESLVGGARPGNDGDEALESV